MGGLPVTRGEQSTQLRPLGGPALAVALVLTLFLTGCAAVKPAQKPPANIGKIEATIAVSHPGQAAFPELTEPRPPGIERLLERTTSNGVAFSGGGTRSLTAVAGQLRALHAMGLVENIRYMTAVSGGSWAAAAFCYYDDGPANDDQLLGPMVSPSQRRNWAFTDTAGESWESLSPNSIGHTATVDFAKPLFHFLDRGPAHEAWQHATGDVYFKPFGLYQPGHPRFFSLDGDSVRDILKRHEALQPSWSESDFVTLRPDRPYPILTATILWPADLTNVTDKVLIEHSPLGIGNPQSLSLKERRFFFRKVEQPTGGGFVEPFAFQSFGPTQPVELPPSGSGLVQMPAAEDRFTLWRASGMSSAAYAASVARIDRDLLPAATYWSPAHAGASPARILRFGDGGNLEDLGIMPLLQRQVRKIVAFANYYVPLRDMLQGLKEGSETDKLMAPLFGVNAKHAPNNQVFASTEYQPLLESLEEARQRGGLPMTKQRYQVLANSWYGIRPYEVEILWVYNGVPEGWIEQLNPKVATMVRDGMQGKGALKDFPHYRTIAENGLHFVEFTTQQVTLLADMFSWSMQQPQARELFEYMLAPPRGTTSTSD